MTAEAYRAEVECRALMEPAEVVDDLLELLLARPGWHADAFVPGGRVWSSRHAGRARSNRHGAMPPMAYRTSRDRKSLMRHVANLPRSIGVAVLVSAITLVSSGCSQPEFTNGGCVNFEEGSGAVPVSCDSDDADARLSSVNDDCDGGRELSFRGRDGDRFFCVTDL